MTVLVIPAGDTATSVASYIGSSRSWADIAAEARVVVPDDVHPLGDAWCVANGVADGIGFMEPLPVYPPPPAPDPNYVDPAVAESLVNLIDSGQAQTVPELRDAAAQVVA